MSASGSCPDWASCLSTAPLASLKVLGLAVSPPHLSPDPLYSPPPVSLSPVSDPLSVSPSPPPLSLLLPCLSRLSCPSRCVSRPPHRSRQSPVSLRSPPVNQLALPLSSPCVHDACSKVGGPTPAAPVRCRPRCQPARPHRAACRHASCPSAGTAPIRPHRQRCPADRPGRATRTVRGQQGARQCRCACRRA